ncbi:MAG: hypothetical protein IPN65_08425 [Elusimicrobia bacterium]|nr:hypothetical protein [Elusimicrobiota bacterium]
MTPLLFLSMVVFGLALSPGVPPNAATAQGALAALAFAPSPDVPGPLAVWFGRFALALFPFGSPAFRLAAATSAMAGIAALVAARLLRHARGDAEGGTALWALEEQRRWTTAETAVLLFWALAGPAWLSARGQWEEALLLTVGAWSVERTLAVARSPSVLRAAAAGGALGLAVAADPRFLCLVPALAALAFLHGRLRPAPSPRLRGWGVGAAFVLTAVAAFLLPAALLAARESATIGQTVTAARVVLENWLRAIGPEAPWGARARAALSPEDIRMPLALALSLFAFWGADRRERRTVGAWLLAGASALFLPGLVSGRRPEVFQSLALLLCVPPLARAARQVLRIRPALGPALFLIPLIFPVFIPRAFPRHEDPEALAGDVFRSAAPGAGTFGGHAESSVRGDLSSTRLGGSAGSPLDVRRSRRAFRPGGVHGFPRRDRPAGGVPPTTRPPRGRTATIARDPFHRARALVAGGERAGGVEPGRAGVRPPRPGGRFFQFACSRSSRRGIPQGVGSPIGGPRFERGARRFVPGLRGDRAGGRRLGSRDALGRGRSACLEPKRQGRIPGGPPSPGLGTVGHRRATVPP